MLFFDLDGTLVDSSVGITRCVAHALEGMGHPGLPASALRGWIGPALRVSFGALFDDPADVERAIALYRERYETHGILEYSAYPGIAEAIATLHARGARMAVVTAKNEPHACRMVAALPFGRLFEGVVGATLDGRLSHKPELIAEALARFGVAASDCTMVGDRHLDVEGARQHGMRAVGVAWGFGSADELADADVLAASPRDLVAALAQAH